MPRCSKLDVEVVDALAMGGALDKQAVHGRDFPRRVDLDQRSGQLEDGKITVDGRARPGGSRRTIPRRLSFPFEVKLRAERGLNRATPARTKKPQGANAQVAGTHAFLDRLSPQVRVTKRLEAGRHYTRPGQAILRPLHSER